MMRCKLLQNGEWQSMPTVPTADDRPARRGKMSLEQIARRPWSGYVAALLLVGIAAGCRMIFLHGFGIQITYRFFYPAVIAAALFGGLSAGLFATGLAVSVIAYFWLEPAGFAIRSHEDLLGLASFLIGCLFLSVLSVLLRRAQQRAAEA